MIGRTVSHYKILEKIGEGGMGEVYLAEDTSLGRKAAVKFLSSDKAADTESRQRFIHEARAQAMLTHTNIATFYEVGEEQDQVFIVMEYIEGQPLSRLAQNEKLSLSEILDIVIQVGEGLQAAHEHSVVHRDIKPENVLVTSKRLAKITDFGLAKWRGATTLTQSGERMGTAYYMSPEQVEGKKLDYRTDLFSLGIILYEMLCGRRPFEGDSEMAVFYELLNSQPQPLARYCRDLPEGLERIVMKCLAKKPEERYQSAADLVADLRKEKKSLEYGKQVPPSATKPKKRLFSFLVPASIVLIAVLLFFILKPFKIEIASKQEAQAKENSLAIMYFENVADPEDKEKMAQMITSLLITDLSESQYLSVVSRQRLYDILKLLGKEDLKILDRSVASQVAQKAQVRWMLTGEVIQIKPNLVLTAEVSEVARGKILATQKVSGRTGEDLFAVVDKLSAEIKMDLSLPEQAKKELDRPVADVTTHSAEAYRYYLEGIDYNNKLYSKEAEESFRKALEFDSTFAMAYYQLTEMGTDDWKEMLAKAVKYSDKVSHKEKCYIRVLQIGYSEKATGDDYVKELKELLKRYPQEKDALRMLGSYYRSPGQFDQSLQYLNKAIEIDPLYKLAYNELAYVYNEMRDFEKSIWAINKYISLAPNEANPYDTRGDLYAYNGRLDQAIESYKKALDIKPDFTMSLEKLGHMYLFKREYAKAESCYYRELNFAPQSDRSWPSWVRILVSHIPVYQGKFESALQFLNDGLAADRVDKIDGWQTAYKHLRKASIYKEKKNPDFALKEIEKCLEIHRRVNPDDKISYRPNYARYLAENKEFARAEEVAEALKKNIKGDQNLMRNYWWTIGSIELEKGNLETSIINLRKAAESNPSFVYRFAFASACLQAGRLDEAVAEFEKVLSRYDNDRAFGPISSVKAYYLLGLAYEKSGWNKKAIEKYEEFLEIWKEADPGIPEVEDAKKRVAELKKRT